METTLNKLFYSLRRALDGIRRRPALYAVSFVTLAATFLSFACTLTAAMNLDHLIKQWVGAAELTVYLKDGATNRELEKLAEALAAIPDVADVTKLCPEDAKESFAAQMTGYEEMVRALPNTTFPASVDVHLKGDAAGNMAGRRALAKRIEAVTMVEKVDLYDTWYSKLMAVSTISQVAAAALGILSLVVSILVVSSTIRASVAARQREIEVMELVGATNRYIRFPFQLEGAIQTTAAMGIALVILHFATDYMQSALRDAMPLIGLNDMIRLGGTSLLLIGGSALAGITGSRISLRRAHPISS